MKLLVLVPILIGVIFCSNTAEAQELFDNRYHIAFRSNGSAIATTDDGGFLIGCSNKSSDNPEGATAPYILKLSKVGTIEWRVIPYYNSGSILSITRCGTHQFIITGGIFSDYLDEDGFIICINDSGRVLWRRLLSEGFQGYVHPATKDSSMILGMYVFHRFETEDTLKGGGIVEINNEGYQRQGIRFKKDSNSYIGVVSVTRLIDGSLVLSAEEDIGKTTIMPLIKLSTSGEVLWHLFINSHTSIAAMAPSRDGGFIVCGSTRENFGENADAFVAKFTTNGILEWGNRIRFALPLDLATIEESMNGDVIAAGDFIACLDPSGIAKNIYSFSYPNATAFINTMAITPSGKYVFTGGLTINKKDSLIKDTTDLLIIVTDSLFENCNIRQTLCAIRPITLPSFLPNVSTISDSVNSVNITPTIADTPTFKPVALCRTESSYFAHELFDASVCTILLDNDKLEIPLVNAFAYTYLTYELCTITGQLMKFPMSIFEDKIVIDAPGLPSGFYLLNIRANNNII